MVLGEYKINTYKNYGLYENSKIPSCRTSKSKWAKNAALKLHTASVLTDELIESYRSPNGLLDMQMHIAMFQKTRKSCTN